MLSAHVQSAESLSHKKLEDSRATEITKVVERVHDHFSHGARFDLTLPLASDLGSKDVKIIERRLIQQGIRLRFHWNAAEHQLQLKMPTPLHETLQKYLPIIRPDLLAQVDAQTRDACMHYEVDLLGNPSLHVGTLGHEGASQATVLVYDILQPDQAFLLTDKETGDELHNSYPVMVFEVAHSQKLRDALLKAWRYLYASEKKIHAVVVYRLSYPVSLRMTFKAELAVWVRSGEDQISYFGCGSEPYKTRSDAGSQRCSGSVTSEATTAVEGDRDQHAQTAWEQGSYVPAGFTDAMVRRGSTVVVLDEAAEEPLSLEPLVLPLSDLIPTCPVHPFGGNDRTLLFDMNRLRTVTKQRLRSTRRMEQSDAAAWERTEESKRKAKEAKEEKAGDGQGGKEHAPGQFRFRLG